MAESEQIKTPSNPHRDEPMHEEPVRTLEPSKLRCEICGKTFTTHSALDRHMEHAHGNPEKTHTQPHDLPHEQ